MKIQNIKLVGDTIVYTCELTKETWDDIAISKDSINSDRNIARFIQSVDENFIVLVVTHHAGIKYIYRDRNSHKEYASITISPEKLSDISSKLENGRIKPYSLKEIIQMEIDEYSFPVNIEEGVWLTNGYIKDNTAYFESTVEQEIDKSDLTYQDLEETKTEIINGLKETTSWLKKDQMEKEYFKVVYIYKDSRAKEFARITIGPEDLE